MNEEEEIRIGNRDLWVKLFEMLQQNWALIDVSDESCRVWFLSDHGEVFDEMDFADRHEAELSLQSNGFTRFVEDPQLGTFLAVPNAPFARGEHINGRIYSSGQFWI